jgi:hypothetical protein
MEPGIRTAAFAATFISLTLVPAAQAFDSSRATIFDLKLGTEAAALLPASRFGELACGSNGGPAMQAVADWSDFARCPADDEGLREITFRYDDEAELVARATDNVPAAWSLGTSLDYFPVIVSALFDVGGTLVGLRIVSDPRYDPRHETFLHLRPRQEHYLLGLYLMDRFGMADTDCRDLPPAIGETPVIGMFAKRSCALTREGRHYTIESRLLRRPGESDVDPVMGTLSQGQYVSETRAEIRLVNPG